MKRLAGIALIVAIAAIALPTAAFRVKAAGPSGCHSAVTLDLFTPTTPFNNTVSRIKIARALARELGQAIGQRGTGRVYARAWDFARAVKSGACVLGLVDATYLAASGNNVTVIAAATHQGATDRGWQLVARSDVQSREALHGKRILVPNVGGRETSFVENGLFDGQLPRDFFRSIDDATDTASALVALTLGKADAAIVPVDVVLPAGVRVVESLPAVSGPLLVAYYQPNSQESQALTAAALLFHGTGAIDGFVAPTGHELADAAKYFTVAATPKK